MKMTFIICATSFFFTLAGTLLYDFTWKTYPYSSEITAGESVTTTALLTVLGAFGVAALFSKD